MTKSFHEMTSKDFDNVAAPVTVKYPHNAESCNLKTFQDKTFA